MGGIGAVPFGGGVFCKLGRTFTGRSSSSDGMGLSEGGDIWGDSSESSSSGGGDRDFVCRFPSLFIRDVSDRGLQFCALLSAGGLPLTSDGPLRIVRSPCFIDIARKYDRRCRLSPFFPPSTPLYR
jgi:hypothetical protein